VIIALVAKSSGTYINRYFFNMASTPKYNAVTGNTMGCKVAKQKATVEWTAPPPFDYASYYNYFLFYATVAFCFATLQPIVQTQAMVTSCTRSIAAPRLRCKR
jgi:hypothetical protein